MIFGLIICTYNRPDAIIALLESVYCQSLIPAEILIIDGSPNEYTSRIIEKQKLKNIKYFKVKKENLGLTKQRNFGISKMPADVEVICFLDDDIILGPHYFRNIIDTYTSYPDAIGVGGHILKEVVWKKIKNENIKFDEFEYDGWVRKLGRRNLLRKRLGLLSKNPPGVMPEFSHGLSISFLPPSGKTYPVEFFMGGVASYRSEIFKKVKFSSYFEGYGLYEDLDFCLRTLNEGQLYVNTSAGLYHYHHEGGRPNKFKYGKMVIRNGWYVWRTKYPAPDYNARLKWHGISFLLTLVRAGNGFTTNKKKEAFYETAGRVLGWLSLMFNPPTINK